jgi:hypothetical protein
MSITELKTLIGAALIDPEFCETLLSENRHASLAEFNLTSEEQETVLNIKADSIQEFAVRLYEWLKD